MPQFYVGQAGPDAVASLQKLWNRVSGTGNAANGGVTVVGAAYTVHIDLDYRVYDLGVLTAASTIAVTGGSVDTDGKSFFVRVWQDATGSRGLTVADASIVFSTDTTAIQITSLANKKSYLGFVYDNSTGKADFITFNRGF